jgi:hypothetical protein
VLRFVRAAAVAAIGLREAAQGLSHRRFHYVALTTVVIISLGAIGILSVERGQNNAHDLFLEPSLGAEEQKALDEARLARIERKLDELLAERQPSEDRCR